MPLLWKHLPKTAGASEKIADMVNPAGLLPADRGYWTYMGSLTIPPCTEGCTGLSSSGSWSMSRNSGLRTFAAIFRMKHTRSSGAARAAYRGHRHCARCRILQR